MATKTTKTTNTRRRKRVPMAKTTKTTRRKTSLSKRAERIVKSLFVKPVENLTGRAARDVPPQTSIRQMDQELDRAGASFGRAELAAFFDEIMNEIKNAPAPLPVQPIPTAKSSLESAVFNLFDALDQELPHGTMALLTCGVGIGRPRRLQTNYETQRLARNVAAVDGELRALRLKEFAQHVLENEYGPFLHVLLQAVWAREYVDSVIGAPGISSARQHSPSRQVAAIV
jgi:hypothetical protein